MHKYLSAAAALALSACASGPATTAQNTNPTYNEYRSPASAHWLTCKPHKNAKDNGYGEIQIKLSAAELSFKGESESHKNVSGTAQRDHAFQDEEQYRFVTKSNDLFVSDADVAFFADKALVKGERGTLGVSNQIICDGDSCKHDLEWGSQGNWTCE